MFDGHVAEVSGRVDSVSGASWQGDDQIAFAERWAQWQVTANAVRLSLTTLAAQLVAAEASYTSNESRTQTGFTQRRQANAEVVELVEDVDEAVDTGLERSRSGGEAVAAGVAAGGVTMRSGRDQASGAPPRSAQTGGGDDE